VSPDSVYQAVASLRRLLGDDPKQPTYIATVPRLGIDWWRRSVPVRSVLMQIVLMKISTSRRRVLHRRTYPTSRAKDAREMGHPGLFFKARFTWATGIVLCLTLAGGFLFASLFRDKVANNSQSVSPALAAQS
jgi:hypothetical protein